MKRMLIAGAAIFAALVTLSGSALAQKAQHRAKAATMSMTAQNPIKNMEMPGRTQQHEQLANLVGDWTITGRTHKGCPYGEGRFTAREHNEFMTDGQFLVSRTQYSSLFNDSNQIAFFGVDPSTGKYTYSMHSSTGITVQATGELRDKDNPSLVGNAIVWTEKHVNVDMHVPQTTMVYTTEVISPDEYRFNMSAGGIIWYDGVAKKMNAVNPARPSRR